MTNPHDNLADAGDVEIDLYSALGLEKGCEEKSIKKAYYKLALRLHPDKIPQDLDETEKEKLKKEFQHVGLAYSILSDPQKRERYDNTGSYGDNEPTCTTFEEWTSYFDAHFGGKVTSESIEKIKSEYQNSEEERRDVIEAYKKGDGDMNKILDSVILSSSAEEKRFIGYIEHAIEEKLIERTKKFTETTSKKAHQKRVREEEKEAKELEESLSEDKGSSRGPTKGNNKDTGSLESLAQLIKANQASREANSDAFFDRLASRYSGARQPAAGSSNKRKKAANRTDSIDEEVPSTKAPRSKAKGKKTN